MPGIKREAPCSASMHPFDLKAALFAKHAQHVVLVHFPIALFLAGVAFDTAATWRKQRSLADAAYYNLLAAALFSIPTLATGLLAWRFQLEGQALKGVLLMHLVLACISTAAMWLVAWLHFRAKRNSRTLSGLRFPIEFFAVALVALTGHLGGFLSGVNIPG